MKSIEKFPNFSKIFKKRAFGIQNTPKPTNPIFEKFENFTFFKSFICGFTKLTPDPFRTHPDPIIDFRGSCEVRKGSGMSFGEKNLFSALWHFLVFWKSLFLGPWGSKITFLVFYAKKALLRRLSALKNWKSCISQITSSTCVHSIFTPKLLNSDNFDNFDVDRVSVLG